METVSRYRHLLFLISSLLLGIVVALSLASGVNYHRASQAVAERRVAFAATATSLALPENAVVAQQPPTLQFDTPEPTLIPTVEDLSILPTPSHTMVSGEAIPTPALLLPEQQQYEMVNFLVLGSDQRGPTRAYRTDVILVMSVNWTTQTVNLLSIPRDLYAYIPGWGMDRINTAELHQTQTNHTNHRLGLLAEAIEYNFGIRIDHIARIDFEGFETVVDMFGGVTLPVDCPVSGYQPAEGGSGWVPFTLDPGLQLLDGNMTLWYVRQRMDSSDFDRNRRQQIVLRALWHKVVSSNLAAQLPELWETLTQYLETDLTLDQALLYVPLFVNLNPAKIESHFLGLNEVNLGQSPSGASVLLIDPEPLARTLNYFMTPPVENQLRGANSRIEVLNSSSIPDAEHLVAAQLEWAGFVAIPVGTAGIIVPHTQVYDFTGQVKNNSNEVIRETLHLADNDVLFAAPDPENTTVDFLVVVGDDYQSCMTSPWIAFPQPE